MQIHGTRRRTLLKGALVTSIASSVGLLASARTLAADEVKFPQDPANLQPGLESAHTPRISLEKVERASVAYGKTPSGDFHRVTVQARHESTREHHMLEIALFVNGENRAQFALGQAESTLPMVVAVLRLQPGDTVMAVTNCNLHGKWGNKLVA